MSGKKAGILASKNMQSLQVVSIKHYKRIAFRVLWIVIAVLVIFGASYYWSLYEDAHTKHLMISMKSSVPGVAQIFYDFGQGFTERNSETRTVHSSEQYQDYRFPFPDNKKIFNLRFDPLLSGGHIEVRWIGITDGLGNSFTDLNLASLVPSAQISRLEMASDHVTVVMEDNANDPQLYVRLKEPLLISQEVHPSYHYNLLLSFGAILLLVLLVCFWVYWKDKKNINSISSHKIR